MTAANPPSPADHMPAAALRRLALNARWTAALLTLTALVWRVVDLSRFATWDELYWTHTTLRFWRAIQAGHWERTAIIGQPAVVQSWLGSLVATLRGWLGGDTVWETIRAAGRPRYAPQDLSMLGALADEWRWFPLMTALVTALSIGGVYLLARRLVGGWAALVGTLLLIVNPFYLAHSRVMALDAVLASLMLLSILACLIYLREGRLRFLALSGVLGGLAALQKTPAIFVFGYVGLLCLVPFFQALWHRRERDALEKGALPFAAWSILAAATYVAVWPAMWAAPGSTLGLVYHSIVDHAGIAFDATFFMGEATRTPGLLFYPFVAALRSSPLTLLGLGCLAWRAARRAPSVSGGTVGALLLYALLFAIALSLTTAKFDRYLLPALLPLDLVAGIGLAAVFLPTYARPQGEGLGTRGKPGWWQSGLGGRASSFVGPWLLAALVLGQALLVLSYHPYYLAWYNPLLGGQRAAQAILPLGWGEGMEQAAHFLAAQPDSAQLRVASWSAAGLAPWFRGQVIQPQPHSPWQAADCAVVYITDVQRGDELAQVLTGRTPLFVGRVHDLDYVWVYRLRD